MTVERLYVMTDINIPITLSGAVTVNEVSDMSVRLVKTSGSPSIEFKLSDDEIDIIASQITLRIPKTAITEDGVYAVYITITDTNGKVLGMTPDPLNLIFYRNY